MPANATIKARINPAVRNMMATVIASRSPVNSALSLWPLAFSQTAPGIAKSQKLIAKSSILFRGQG
jgi:hypothetical protein